MNKLIAVALLTLLASSRAEDITPLNPSQILQELKDIQAKSEATATARQKQRIEQVFKAAATKETALAFYEDALMATQFQGVTKENTQFRDWKKKNEEQLKDSAFRESVRLHLFYLWLSLKKAAGAKPEELIPKVTEYVNILEGASDALNAKGSLLKQSVSGGIFAQWLGLGPDLAQATDWEMNPGNEDQIATKFLLPEWRKQKNPAVLGYWDGRIARESEAAASAKLDFKENNFASIRKPTLLWQRAHEFIILDQPNRATQEMFGLIKTFPNHPEVGNWIAELQKLLDPTKI